MNCKVCPSETIERTTSEGSPAAAAPSFPSACKTLPLSSNSRASSSAEGPRTISTAAWLLRAPVNRPGDEMVATRSSAGRESGVSVPGPKTTGLYGLVASARVTRSASANELKVRVSMAARCKGKREGGFTCRVIESDEDQARVLFEAVRESGSEVQYELNELVPVPGCLGE